MTTLCEIEAAAEALPLDQKKELYRFLEAQLGSSSDSFPKARLLRQANDSLLEAPPDAPPMTPENVKRMLADWP